LSLCVDTGNTALIEHNVFAYQTYNPMYCWISYDEAPEDWVARDNLMWGNAEDAYVRTFWGTYTEADPMFVAWSDDGDDTNDDLRLQPGSPAIDAATTATLLTDHDGIVRPIDGDGDGVAVADLGAYEWWPDGDSDGHAATALGGDDCDDADPAVHADADDPLDGLDQNCDGVDGIAPEPVDTADPDADDSGVPPADSGQPTEPPPVKDADDGCDGCATTGGPEWLGLVALALARRRRAWTH
jgi:hypothetical protein